MSAAGSPNESAERLDARNSQVESGQKWRSAGIDPFRPAYRLPCRSARGLFLSIMQTISFLSRNGGKKWKKINPKWAGKAVRIELTPPYSSRQREARTRPVRWARTSSS